VTLGAQLDALDAAALTPIVRLAVRDETLVPDAWTCRALVGGRAGTTAGIYRLAGAGDRPWSVVLKILTRSGGVDVPGDYRYWRREPLVLASGLLDDLPHGLRGPRCFAVEERGETLWLWLEDAPDTFARPWPIERFALAARHLGRFNGAYLAGRPLPDHARETVAIDWAFAGIGALGEDLAVLLRSRPRDGAGYGYAAFDAALFPAYLAGLRDAGWHGDPRAVRLGFTAAVVLRYALNCFPLRAFDDPAAQSRLAASVGWTSFERLVDWAAELRAYAFELAEETRELAG
jgi:hypothetical protein